MRPFWLTARNFLKASNISVIANRNISKKYTADEIIKKFKLEPHVEGGYYQEIYRAPEKVVAHWNAKVVRDLSTSCYYLVKKTDQMVLHRIKTLEIWNYHCGLPVNYVEIRPGKDKDDPNSYTLVQKVMGADFDKDEVPQIIIQPGCWYGGYPIHPENKNHDHKPGETFGDNLDDYVFFGCSCSPSFEFEEFETGNYEELKEFFKERKDILPIIEKLGWRN